MKHDISQHQSAVSITEHYRAIQSNNLLIA